MRLSAAAASLLIGLSVGRIAFAMDSEPDGFRGIKWGASPVGLSGPGWRISDIHVEHSRRILGRASSSGWDDSKDPELPELKNSAVLAWMQRNLSTFMDHGGKNEFSGVQASTLYIFYKNQFLQADLTFMSNSMHPTTSVYRNEEKVDAALVKYFGIPDRQKMSFLDRLGYSAEKPTYQGQNMNIMSACGYRQSAFSTCMLTFQSDEIREQLKNDLKNFQLQLAADRNAENDRRTKDQADKAAKPDY